MIEASWLQCGCLVCSNIASSAIADWLLLQLDFPIAGKRHFGVHWWRADGRGFVLPCSSEPGLHGEGKLSFIRVLHFGSD